MPNHDHHQMDKEPGLFRSRAGIVTLGFLAIVIFLLFTEHRAHVLGALIWLPLLACPLMHLFMHGGHGHHGHGREDTQDENEARRS